MVKIHMPMQETQETWVQPLDLEDPLKQKERQPTPVFLLEKFREQSSLVNYSPWGCQVGHH